MSKEKVSLRFYGIGALPTGHFDQQIDRAGRRNYWRLYVELICPSCKNVFWANYSTMHMNGKKCPKCHKLLYAPPRILCEDEPKRMPSGGLRVGES